MPNEVIKPPLISDNKLIPGLNYIGNKTKVKFVQSFLKQHKITFTHGTIVNIYIAYELKFSNHRTGDVTNSWLDDKLLQTGLKFFEIEVILPKERIKN